MREGARGDRELRGRDRRGTKKERAKRLARTDVLRQIDHERNPIGGGGAVDLPTVITMDYGLGVEFTHKTVGDAFQTLATEWDSFELQAGTSTKDGGNKRPVAAGVAIPNALWQLYRA